MKIIKKILGISLGLACFMLALSLSVSPASVRAEGDGSVEIGYSVSFTEMSPYSKEWQADAYDYNFVTVAPSNQYLGVGQENVSADGEGFVVYNVVAKNGRTIKELGLKMNARVFHLNSHDGCNCHLSVSVNNGDGYAEVHTYPVGFDGGLQSYQLDFTEYASGKKSVLVKFDLVGLQWDWVGISSLEFTGSYNAATDEILFEYESDVSGVQVAQLAKKTSLVPARAYNTKGEFDYTVKITAPDGSESEATDAFTPLQLGLYTVTYIVENGENTAQSSYKIFVVKKTDIDAYSKDGFGTAGYYMTEDGTVTATEKGVELAGKGSYVLPLEYHSLIKFVWEFASVSEGGKAQIALLNTPGVPDFAKMNKDGFYFTFYNGGAGMTFNATFVGKGRMVMLGNHPDGFYSASAGKHALEIRRSTAAAPYENGAEMFVDGVRFSDWLGYSQVNLAELVSGGELYFAYDVSSSAKITVLNIVPEDSAFPIIRSQDGVSVPRSGTVGESVVLPEYTAIDEVDGERPVQISVTDPYRNEIALDENNSFVPLYEGTYRVSVTSVDLSGNMGERKSSIMVSLKEGMCEFRFTQTVSNNARVGKAYEIAEPKVTNLKDGESYTVKVTDPDGLEVTVENNSFVPQKIGEYSLVYSATNELGTSYRSFTVHAKIDVDERDSYDNFADGDYWVSESDSYELTDGGVRLWGASYLKLPFDMTNGLEITLKPETMLDKYEEYDCWFSVGLINFPSHGSYAAQIKYGVYFMVFKAHGNYEYNVLSYGGTGVAQTIVSNCVIGSVEDVDQISIRVEKYTGDASFDNNVVIYVNNVKNANYSVFNIALSDMMDNESFTYLCFDTYVQNPGDSRKDKVCMELVGTGFSDYVAPIISMDGNLASSASVGDSVAIPQISAADAVDGGVDARVRLYAPSGKVVDISSGSFTVESEGRYVLVVKAKDSSGNSVTEIYNINVGNANPVKEYILSVNKTEDKKRGCGSFAGGSQAIAIALLGGFGYALKRKEDSNE